MTARGAWALVLAFLTITFAVVCVVRMTADGFAVLAVLSLIGCSVAAGAYERSFWAR